MSSLIWIELRYLINWSDWIHWHNITAWNDQNRAMGRKRLTITDHVNLNNVIEYYEPIDTFDGNQDSLRLTVRGVNQLTCFIKVFCYKFSMAAKWSVMHCRLQSQGCSDYGELWSTLRAVPLSIHSMTGSPSTFRLYAYARAIWVFLILPVPWTARVRCWTSLMSWLSSERTLPRTSCRPRNCVYTGYLMWWHGNLVSCLRNCVIGALNSERASNCSNSPVLWARVDIMFLRILSAAKNG